VRAGEATGVKEETLKVKVMLKSVPDQVKENGWAPLDETNDEHTMSIHKSKTCFEEESWC